MATAAALAARDPTPPLRPFRFERRAPDPRDVRIDIQSCDRGATTCTYHSKDRYSSRIVVPDRGPGSWSRIVVDEAFRRNVAAADPLM